MCECKLFYFGALVLCNVIFVTSFNIDDLNYAVYGLDTPSMFGFTVAVHKDRGNNPWVLVGAPEAQSRYHYPYEITKGGAVYKCRPEQDNACDEVAFDREPNNKRLGAVTIDNKTHQWFGATLSTARKTDGPVVACAPRYIWFTGDLNRRDPVGTCFVSNGGFDSFEEYSPCRTRNWGYHRQGSCQAGFSAAINSDGDRLYIGAPGSYYWQGTVHQQSLETRPPVFSTREGSPRDDDSYMGYSIVSGHFKEHEQYEGIAVGMPRGNGLKGKVLLFTWKLTNYKNITVSQQIGSYFGYSITAADINGDKKLDIIVGAPMHTEPNNEMKYDVGRVYVFYQSSNESQSFSSFHFIDGVNSKSRFGLAVSTLGDLNQDGYDDIAVGAPYDGVNGRGAVYIYYGSKEGIRKKYGQVIFAESIQSRIPLKTFGFSVAGGMDLDDNDYPDMAVGAYLSDSAIFFRSRPVVLVDAYVRYETAQKQIDIQNKNCKHNGQQTTCTAITFCMKYTGKGIPSSMPFTVQYILDSKKPNTPRMGFLTRGTHTFNNTIQLVSNKENCETYDVYVKNDIRDKLTPLDAEVNYFLIEHRDGITPHIRNPQSLLRPVLDLNSPPSRKDSITVQKNCGPDNICIPDLHVNVTSNVQKHLLGSDVDLGFNVVVSNIGEDSFETTFKMNYSKGIHFRKVETEPHMPAILCSPNYRNNTITCDIGNPLPRGKIAKFSILFQPPAQEEGVALTYDFDVYVNSSNPEDAATTRDNHQHLSIDIWVDASLELTGNSYPSTVYYNESLYTSKEIIKEGDIGPQITHVYYLRNRGPSIIREAEVYILWPHKTLGDEDLLYLLEQPHTQGNVKCDAFQQYIEANRIQELLYNYRRYELDYHSASIWDRLKIDTSNVVKNVSEEPLKTGIKIETGKGVSSGEGVVNTNVASNRSTDSVTNFSSLNSQGTIQTDGLSTTTTSRYYTETINGVTTTTLKNITTVRDANGNILAQSLTVLDNGIPKTTWQNFTTIKDNNGNIKARSRTVVINGIPTTTWDNTTFFEESFFESRGQALDKGFAETTWQNFTTVKDSNGNILARSRTVIIDGIPITTWDNVTFFQNNFAEDGRQVVDNGIVDATWQNFTTITDSNGNILARSRTTVSNGIPTTTWDNVTFFRDYFSKKGGEIDGRTFTISSKARGHQGGVGTRYEESRPTGSEQRFGVNEAEDRRHYNIKSKGTQAVSGHQIPGQFYGQEERTYEVGGGPREGGTQSQYETGQFQGQYGQRGVQGQYGQGQFQEQYGQGHLQSQQGLGQGSSQGQTYGSRTFSQGSYQQNVGDGRQVYFGEPGVYQGPSGQVQFNKTYTVEGTIPIDISGLQSNQQKFGEIPLGRGFNLQNSGFEGASESSLAGSITGQSQSGDIYSQGTYGQGQGAYGQSGSVYYQSGGTYGQGAGTYGQSAGAHSQNGNVHGQSEGRFAGGQDLSSQGGYSRIWHTEGSFSQSGKIPPTILHNNVERDNVPTDTPKLNQRYRGKRVAEDFFEEILGLQNCVSTNCTYIRCVVGSLDKDKEIAIALRSRLNVRAVKDLRSSHSVKLSSMMIGRINKLPYVGVPKEDVLRKHEISTIVPAKETELVPEVAPLWIYVVSAVAGVVMLLLLIWILSKCGFFKRNRPSSAPERQPLNRNGYHSGDEAL